MEEIIDYDVWEENFKYPPLTFTATFDPQTGKVVSIGPSAVYEGLPNTISVDTEIAESIIEGKLKLSSCFVDISSNVMEVTENRAAYKIDDVLHRIITAEHAEFDIADLFIVCDLANNSLEIQLSEVYDGFRVLPDLFQPVRKKRVNWSGDTEMNFFVTEYNDPNVVHTMFSVKISDLIGKHAHINNITFPKKFSVYTRRIFKNYVVEYK